MSFVDLEWLKKSPMFDQFAWQAAQEIDLRNAREIEARLPAYLQGIDSERRDTTFFPTFQACLSATAIENLGIVYDMMYPKSDYKGAQSESVKNPSFS